MPIYEYLCPHCNRIFSFLARSGQVDKQPTCPKCGASDLTRRISRFAFVRASGGRPRADTGGMDAGPVDRDPRETGAEPPDDPRVEREMMRLMQDAEGLDESDPRQLGSFMRRMSALSGEPLDPEMEDAVRRLESGEDPEKVEEDMGDLFGDEEAGDGGPFGFPSRDEGLYPMD